VNQQHTTISRYALPALFSIALLAGCPGPGAESFAVGDAVFSDGRVSVDVPDGAGKRVSVGILLVEQSPLLTGGDPLTASLRAGGLLVNGGPVEVVYGEIKPEYFQGFPESCREIAQLGRNQTFVLPDWVAQRIRDGRLMCIFVTEGAGTKDDPLSNAAYWLRPIRIADGGPEDESAEEPAAAADQPEDEAGQPEVPAGPEAAPDGSAEAGADPAGQGESAAPEDIDGQPR